MVSLWYISFLSSAKQRREWPYSKFFEQRERTTVVFLFLFHFNAIPTNSVPTWITRSQCTSLTSWNNHGHGVAQVTRILPRGGEGAYSIMFNTVRLRPEVHTSPFNILIFTGMIPLSYAQSKIAPLSYTSRISQNNRISYNCHVFLGFSVVLNQLRSHFCQNAGPFHILRFSRHFFTLQLILWPFRILKWQFSLLFNILPA